MAWITITATAGGWLAALNAAAFKGKVEVSVSKSSGVIGTFDVPSGWLGNNMMPPIYRHTIMQVDTTYVTEYRGLAKDSAISAVTDSSFVTIDTPNPTQVIRSTAEAVRANEADGWVVRRTTVSSITTDTATVVA
jgi:hypothetical protein